MTEKNLTALVFARGGSKGVKNKNIRLAGGVPLIGRAIACGLESRYVSRVVVSTDSAEIADVARQFGADIQMRPPELAADDTPEIQAWNHAIDSLPDVFGPGKQELFISLPPTVPLRVATDVDAAVESFRKTDCDIVWGISPSQTNPYFTMVTIDDNNLTHICIEGSKATRRQDIPNVYDIVGGVYVTTSDYVKKCAINKTRLIDGRVSYFLVPPERAMDIDTEYDLYLADILLRYPYQGPAD